MALACNFNEWINVNKNYYDFYLNTYPFLKNMSMPLSFDKVKNFYINDIESRNFEPNPAMLNCYELLFTYFCENYDRTLTNTQGAVVGKTRIEYIVDALPSAISKTANQAAEGVSEIFKIGKQIALYLIIVSVIILVIYFTIKNKWI